MKWLSALLLAGALSLGLFVRSTASPFAGAWFVLFSLSCLVLLFTGRHSLPRNTFTYALLAWGVYITIHAYFYIHTLNADFFWTVLIAPVIYFLAMAREDRNEILRTHIIACGAVLLGLALMACYQSISTDNVHWPFHNRNNLSAILNMGLVVAVGLALKDRRLWWIVIPFVVAQLGTGSKGGLLSAFIACLILTYRKSFAYYATLGAMLCTVLILASGGFFESVASTMDARVDLWLSTINMIVDHPMGVGLGIWNIYYPQYTDTIIGTGMFAHCDPLQFAAEMGIGAMILFYILCGVATARTTQASLIPFCAILAVVLHTHISFHLYHPAIMILLSICLVAWEDKCEKVSC